MRKINEKNSDNLLISYFYVLSSHLSVIFGPNAQKQQTSVSVHRKLIPAAHDI